MLNKQRSKKLIGNDYIIPIRDGKKTKTVSEKPGIPTEPVPGVIGP